MCVCEWVNVCVSERGVGMCAYVCFCLCLCERVGESKCVCDYKRERERDIERECVNRILK